MPQKFLVPQYIDVEPKIIGNITIRQFMELLYAGMVGFLIWKIFEKSNQNLGILLIVLHTIIWIVIAFTKVNGQHFHLFFLNLVRTLKKPKLRIWLKGQFVKVKEKTDDVVKRVIATKSLPPRSRLSDLSLMVDTGGAYNAEVEVEKTKTGGEVEEINI